MNIREEKNLKENLRNFHLKNPRKLWLSVGGSGGNQCHVFAELDPDQPARQQ